METIFDLRNVYYSYVGKIDALKNVTLNIKRGEQVTIIGSNGSGKSTLLAILDGLVYPTSGEFYAFGNLICEDVFDSIADNEFRSYFRTKVGFVFQNSDVQLFSPQSMRRLPSAQCSLACLLPRCEAGWRRSCTCWRLESCGTRSPHTLSGGEKKKVCDRHSPCQQPRYPPPG